MVISGSIPVKLSIKISFLENFLASKVATKYFKARFNDIQCSGNCFQRKHKKKTTQLLNYWFIQSHYSIIWILFWLFNGFLNHFGKLSWHEPWTQAGTGISTAGHESWGFLETISKIYNFCQGLRYEQTFEISLAWAKTR